MNTKKYNLEDFKGRRFGRLVVTGPEEAVYDSRGKLWRAFWCQCDCGNRVLMKIYNFTDNASNPARSCGCLGEENKQYLGKLHRMGQLANPKYKHGLYHTRLNKIWKNMRHRCNLVNNPNYPEYGGRGIKVCPEWNDSETGFLNFYNWAMTNGYSDELSIDRIDNDQGYYPWNCRWTTQSVQAQNTRNAQWVNYYGFHYNIHDWCLLLNLDYNTVMYRLQNGWSEEDALGVPKFVPLDGLEAYKSQQPNIIKPILELDMNKIKHICNYEN